MGEFARAFEAGFNHLRAAVIAACAEHEEWPAKVAAAIYAALDFAVEEPTAVRVLAIDALIERAEGGRRYVEMIGHFADLLRAEAPRDERLPASTEQALVGGISVIVAERMRGAGEAALWEAGPELVQITLLPYVGMEEAKRWARETARQ